MKHPKPSYRNPWTWVPSLYLAEGIPYAVVMTVSVVLYKRLGISNTDIALYTSWLYLPWVIKPFWSPLVDMFRTKRFWILAMQVLLGASLAAVALTIPVPDFFRWTLAVFWLMAFSSATHDIAADGFYMLGLSQREQAAFIGVRNMFYRIAMISAQGLLVILAGLLERRCPSVAAAWSATFFVLAGFFLASFLYHFFVLPYPASDRPAPRGLSKNFFADFLNSFALFFGKRDIAAVIAFLLFYRFAEAQLMKMVVPFLLDPRAAGGLGLSTAEVGIVYGTVGVVMLMLGGLIGGYVVSRQGLKSWLWTMVAVMHLPDLVFVYLSWTQPENFFAVAVAVAVEQFGYGFGFTAYALFMILASEGEYKTIHYAVCTGFMALGMMIPGMFSGWVQEMLGYRNFFLWIMVSTIPGFIVPALVDIEPGFGKRGD
ncbi:MAG TPA: AmpG family muropeptide MFS transporter [Syntrophales bacterium]|nr:AmpG family muropeptide MFS transporter [Syntrophobacterales bacterium]HRT26615.1 AmpG family muropeptide MFS transporter [Syntrophales bacterium]HRT69868.1 AmpG family muropeptide MFS transporter [Syntrophales bacterium]